MSWTEYVAAFQAQFGEELFGNPILEMKNLHQEGSFLEYQSRFDALLHRVQLVEEVSERVAANQVIGGLELNLQGPLRIHHPQNLQEAYVMTKLHSAIIKSQLRSHPHVKLYFPPGKQSPTAMGIIGSNTAVGNHVAIYKGVNVGAKKYTDHKGTRLTNTRRWRLTERKSCAIGVQNVIWLTMFARGNIFSSLK